MTSAKWNFDFSWEAQTTAAAKTAGIAERYMITTAPDGSEALQVTLNANDVTMTQGSDTCPRTELSGIQTNLSNDVVYTATWD